MLKIFIVITIIINCLMGIVRTEEDVCTLIFDDCHTCVATEGCGWCDSGFCLSQSDYLFTCKNELSNDEKICPEATPIRYKRDVPLCSVSSECSECNLIQGCAWCIYFPNSTTEIQTCQPISSPDPTNCPMSQYTVQNSTFVINCPNSGSTTQPVHTFTENGVSPPAVGKKRHEIAPRTIPNPKIAINLTADDICLYFARGLNQIFQDIGSSIRVSVSNCDVQIWRSINPDNTSGVPVDANGELQLRWIGLPENQVFEIENNTNFIIQNYNPYILPIVIAHITGGGGSGPLSPGQVAGITIGSIFAFFLLLLLLLLLILVFIRRRPQSGPFRAPQASFRP